MEGSTGTGRLFRSLHAEGTLAEEAIIALDPDEVVVLRSVSLRGDSHLDPDFAHLFTQDRPGSPPDTPQRGPSDLDPDDDSTGEQVSLRTRLPSSTIHRHRPGIPAWVAVSLIVVTTAVIGIADVVISGSIGWLTGITLVLASAYAATSVRTTDAYWVVVTPPLAFLATTVTIGQVTISGGGFWVRQGLLIPFTLGQNALWIVAATVIAALIVGARRRRAIVR